MGDEVRDLGLGEGKGLKQEEFMGPSGLLPMMSGKPLPVRLANGRQRKLHEEEITWLEREGTLSREEEEIHKKKENCWDYDNDCPAEVEAEGDTMVGLTLTAPMTSAGIIPVTPRGPGDPVYISSSRPERDTTMSGVERGVEGLEASRHAPVTGPQEVEDEEEKEVGLGEDTEMESGEAGGEGEIRMFPQKAKMVVDALVVFMKSTKMEGEDKKGPRRRLAKTKEVIWALGRALDQEEKGIP